MPPTANPNCVTANCADGEPCKADLAKRDGKGNFTPSFSVLS